VLCFHWYDVDNMISGKFFIKDLMENLMEEVICHSSKTDKFLVKARFEFDPNFLNFDFGYITFREI
jgi:hypothetical protein